MAKRTAHSWQAVLEETSEKPSFLLDKALLEQDLIPKKKYNFFSEELNNIRGSESIDSSEESAESNQIVIERESPS